MELNNLSVMSPSSVEPSLPQKALKPNFQGGIATESKAEQQVSSVASAPLDDQVVEDKKNKDSEDLQVSQEKLDELMGRLNEGLKTLQSYVQFEKDQDTERMVFFIKNSETDEVIRQIPSKEFLNISKNISDYLEMVQQISPDKPQFPVGMITNEVV